MTARLTNRRWSLLPAVLLAVVAGAGVGDVRVGSTGVAWMCIAFVVLTTGAVVAVAAVRGRLLEPLPVVSFVVLVALGLRPAQLLADRASLLVFERPTTSVGSLIGLSSQEIAYFVDRKLVMPLDAAFEATAILCAAFVACVGIGCCYRPAHRVAAHIARASSWTDHLDMRSVVVAFCGVGLVGQAAIYVRIGGPGAALNSILDQSNLAAGFVVFALANFLPVALLLWLAWHPPASVRSRWLMGALVVEMTAFYTTLGSRALALYPLLMLLMVYHYRVAPISTRRLAVVLGAVLILASAYLGVRQATFSQSGTAALRSSVSYLVNPSAIANDNSAFDSLLEARVLIGDSVPHRHGRSLVNAVSQFVPTAVWSGKPESNDIWFRKAMWGERFRGGRPYTLPGELWADFGLPGVLVGGLLFGALLRFLTSLVPRGPLAPPLWSVLIAVAMVTLYVLIVGVYTIATAFAIQYLLPVGLALLLTNHQAVRRRWRAGGT